MRKTAAIVLLALLIFFAASCGAGNGCEATLAASTSTAGYSGGETPARHSETSGEPFQTADSGAHPSETQTESADPPETADCAPETTESGLPETTGAGRSETPDTDVTDGASPSDPDSPETESPDTAVPTKSPDPPAGPDYLVLVNRSNRLPDGWEEEIALLTVENVLGKPVKVEKNAYAAFLSLRAALETEGVYIELDSAWRSVEEQRRIMERFIEEYGEEYAKNTVAPPGCSEHHTGLALDLCLIVDGKVVRLNEEMMRYPELWRIVHDKLPAFGFILRYPEGREEITGYGYEPWHVRYIGDAGAAAAIAASGQTLEEYTGTTVRARRGVK